VQHDEALVEWQAARRKTLLTDKPGAAAAADRAGRAAAAAERLSAVRVTQLRALLPYFPGGAGAAASALGLALPAPLAASIAASWRAAVASAAARAAVPCVAAARAAGSPLLRAALPADGGSGGSIRKLSTARLAAAVVDEFLKREGSGAPTSLPRLRALLGDAALQVRRATASLGAVLGRGLQLRSRPPPLNSLAQLLTSPPAHLPPLAPANYLLPPLCSRSCPPSTTTTLCGRGRSRPAARPRRPPAPSAPPPTPI
jgi:hypothetical protein